MDPWYNGFGGNIERAEQEGRYVVKGKFERVAEDKLRITELPVKKWTREYKNYLEELATSEKLKDIKEFHKDNKIDFQIKFPKSIKDFASSDDDLEKKLKLTSSISCNNFVLFDRNCHIKKYADETEIMDEFFEVRYAKYQERKAYLLKKFTKQFETLKCKMNFIQGI